jgi:hypothetical protein
VSRAVSLAVLELARDRLASLRADDLNVARLSEVAVDAAVCAEDAAASLLGAENGDVFDADALGVELLVLGARLEVLEQREQNACRLLGPATLSGKRVVLALSLTTDTEGRTQFGG